MRRNSSTTSSIQFILDRRNITMGSIPVTLNARWLTIGAIQPDPAGRGYDAKSLIQIQDFQSLLAVRMFHSFPLIQSSSSTWDAVVFWSQSGMCWPRLTVFTTVPITIRWDIMIFLLLLCIRVLPTRKWNLKLHPSWGLLCIGFLHFLFFHVQILHHV